MKKFNLKKILNSKPFQLLIILVVLAVIFTVLSGGGYMKALNIRNILNSMVLTSFMAIGVGFLLVSGNMDLSMGYVGTFGGTMMALLMTNLGWPWPIAVIGGIVVGGLCGMVNGILVNYLGFQSFIATLAMNNVANGLTLVVSKGVAIPVKAKALTWIGSAKFANGLIPFAVIISLLFIIVYGIILSKTQFGRKMYLCGGNPQAARLAGLNPKKLSMILFTNAGCLSAISGIMAAARQKTATTTSVSTYTFTGMTAALVGGISFGGGTSGMFGCFMGLLVLNAFNNGMSVLGINSYWQQVASGALLIIALGVDYISMARTQKKALEATKAANASKA